MPDFPIIDAHLHLWDPDYFRMPWLDDAPTLNRRFGLSEFQEHTRGVAVEGMVYLEVDVAPSYALLEARHIAQLAQQDPRLLGIVAYAPVEYGERVRTYLAALTEIGTHIKGVRRIIQAESDVAFCLRPDFVRGVQLLAEYGLSFDVCAVHTQLPSVIQLVGQCPNVSFILDHIGKPNIKEHVLDPWRDHMHELASYSNVVCKISGLVTEADLQYWTVDDLGPYVEHVLNTFGEDRVVFGGDWPVATLATDYLRWVKTLDTLTSHLSLAAKRKLWVENARHFYRLS